MLSRCSYHRSQEESVIAYVPFDYGVRNFISESRRWQTLYCNLEGSYNRRRISNNDKEALEEFVNCTLYSNRNGDLLDQEKKCMKNICDKMISLSKMYTKDEVHFTAIWIYYYDYDKESAVGVPLFKVYQETSGNRANYIDVDSNCYKYWDAVLDSVGFPQSFICAPRNGEYVFVDNMVNLEYISSNALHQKSFRRFTFKEKIDIAKMNFASYSQSVIMPWFLKIKRFGRNFMNNVVEMALVLLSHVKSIWNHVDMGSLAVLLIRTLTLWKEGGFTSISIALIAKDILMLGNKFVDSERLDSQSDFSSGSGSSLTTKVPGFENPLRAAETLETLKKCCSLKDFVKNPSFASLKSICKDFITSEASKSLLLIILALLPSGTIFKVVGFLSESCLDMARNALNSSQSLEMREVIRSTEAVVSAVGDQAVSSENVRDFLTDRALVETFSNLDKLTEVPYGQLFTKAYRRSANDFLEKLYSTEYHSLRDFLSQLKRDGSVVLFSRTSFQEVFQKLEKLNGGKTQVKHMNEFVWEVSDFHGKVGGYLISLNRDTILGVFPREKGLAFAEPLPSTSNRALEYSLS